MVIYTRYDFSDEEYERIRRTIPQPIDEFNAILIGGIICASIACGLIWLYDVKPNDKIAVEQTIDSKTESKQVQTGIETKTEK